MGLLDYFDPDQLRGKLKGLLGGMPITQALRGEASVTPEGLRQGLLAMKPFSGDAGQSAYDAAVNIGPMGLAKIVYHGSPHKFDKFDASKIGTGEGAQAYGHGIYLADAEDIGKRYRDTLTHYNPDVLEAKLIESGVSKDTANTYAQFAAQTNGAKVSFDKFAELINGKSPIPTIENFRAARRAELPQVKGVVDGLEGSLYKADLPDEWIPKMLDWDKPLSQQSQEVMSALNSGEKTKKILKNFDKQYKGGMPPSAFLLHGQDVIGGRGATEAYLNQLGIPGIRYLDGGSRPNSGRISMLEQTIANLQGKGASKAAITNAQRELDAELARASYNYVVFPGLEDKVKILERNGMPLK